MAASKGSEYSAHALLLAAGSRYRRLGVSGEENYIGVGSTKGLNGGKDWTDRGV